MVLGNARHRDHRPERSRCRGGGRLNDHNRDYSLTVWKHNPDSDAAELQSISVTPATTSVAKGQTQQFKAIGTFSDGGTADLTSTVAWAFRCHWRGQRQRYGSGYLSCRWLGRHHRQVGDDFRERDFECHAGGSAIINIAPQPAAVALGFSTQLSATEKYTDGSSGTLPVTWTSATPSVATVAANTGMATSVALGTSTISATAGSLTAHGRIVSRHQRMGCDHQSAYGAPAARRNPPCRGFGIGSRRCRCRSVAKLRTLQSHDEYLEPHRQPHYSSLSTRPSGAVRRQGIGGGRIGGLHRK